MDKEIIFIGIGIYGLILASGFLLLSTVRVKKADVTRELVYRMMKTVDDGVRSGIVSQHLNTGDVRILNSTAGGPERPKAFPFMNDPQWNGEGPKTEMLAGNGTRTELLIPTGDKTEILASNNAKTEVLRPGTEKTELL